MTGVYIAPVLGELTNPGYIGGYKLMDRGIKRAAFNHITPMKYSDSSILPMTKTEELKAIIKDVPKQILNQQKFQNGELDWKKCLGIVQKEIIYLVNLLVIMIL